MVAKQVARNYIVHEVWVRPKGPFWQLIYDGERLGRFLYKRDAVSVGHFIAQLIGVMGGEGTELSVCLRNGKIEERSTFPRAADPRASKG